MNRCVFNEPLLNIEKVLRSGLGRTLKFDPTAANGTERTLERPVFLHQFPRLLS